MPTSRSLSRVKAVLEKLKPPRSFWPTLPVLVKDSVAQRRTSFTKSRPRPKPCRTKRQMQLSRSKYWTQTRCLRPLVTRRLSKITIRPASESSSRLTSTRQACSTQLLLSTICLKSPAFASSMVSRETSMSFTKCCSRPKLPGRSNPRS